jgi:hypothetical protein
MDARNLETGADRSAEPTDSTGLSDADRAGAPASAEVSVDKWSEWAQERFGGDPARVEAAAKAAKAALAAGANAEQAAATAGAAADEVLGDSWRAWAQATFPGDERKARAAASAALEAARTGVTAEQAVSAGTTAAEDVPSRTPPPPSAPVPTPVPNAPAPLVATESGGGRRLRGRAIRVQQRQEMHGRRYFYVWEFAVQRQSIDAANPPPLVQVEMRGVRFDGAINEGDEVEIDRTPKPGRVLHTRKVQNLTANAPFRVRGLGQAPVGLQYFGSFIVRLAAAVFFIVVLAFIVYEVTQNSHL